MERPCLSFSKCEAKLKTFWQVLPSWEGSEELAQITFCPECGSFKKEYFSQIKDNEKPE